MEKDSLWVITLPYINQISGDSLFQRGFWIYSTAPVSVYQVMGSNNPNDREGTAFYSEATVLSKGNLNDTLYPFGITSVSDNFQQQGFISDFTEIRVLSDEDSNQINIATSTFISNSGVQIYFPPDTLITYHLNKGDIKVFNSFRSERQVNQTRIYSANQKSFKIYVNSNSAKCSNSDGFAGAIIEDGKPFGYEGTSFHVGPLVDQPCRVISLMAAEDATDVFFDGVFVRRLNRLDRMDTCVAAALHITSSNGLFGFEGKCNYHEASIYEDAANGWSVTLSSDDELIKETLFSTITQPDTGVQYFIKVVAKTNSLGALRLNGNPIAGNLFSPFPADPQWSYGLIEIPPGLYKLQSDSGFHAIHFTHYPFVSPPFQPAATHPIYGHALAESIIWPEDSFFFKVGYSATELEPFSVSSPTVCAGDPVYFQPGHLRHRVWHYNFGDGSSQLQEAGNTLAPVVSHIWQQAGQFWVIISDTSGCYPSDSVLVTVRPSASDSYTASTSNSCEGAAIFLT
ncbi:MAG: hypothetical protein LAT76_00630 [Schleiferiaceae bacterium]|nr:hypothetical protein [Schleiferiaceae bacterium]